MTLLRAVALIAIPIGAVGALVFFFRAADHPPPLLVVLFVLWLLSPFALLLWANVRSRQWSPITCAALHAVTIVIALASIAVYGNLIAVMPHGSPKAAPFVIVAPASWLVIATIVPLAALVSRRRTS